MKNLQVKIDDEQYKALRILAIDQNTTVSDIIRELVGNFVGGGVG